MAPTWTALAAAMALVALAALMGHRQVADTVPPDARAALCAIAKDEGLYIDEWVSYHLALGFDTVYVYDNSQANDLKDLPARHPAGRVRVRHWPLTHRQQQAAYNHFLGAADGHTWAAFMDIDEFLVLKKHGDVKSLLKEHCRRGALGVNWYLFGSSGLQRYEPGSVLARFRRRDARVNRHVKTLARLDDLLEMDVHNPAALTLGTTLHDTSGRAFSGPYNPGGPTDVAVVHHYFTKSRGEFARKRARGMAAQPGVRDWSVFDDHDCNDVQDDGAVVAAARLGLL